MTMTFFYLYKNYIRTKMISVQNMFLLVISLMLDLNKMGVDGQCNLICSVRCPCTVYSSTGVLQEVVSYLETCWAI